MTSFIQPEINLSGQNAMLDLYRKTYHQEKNEMGDIEDLDPDENMLNVFKKETKVGKYINPTDKAVGLPLGRRSNQWERYLHTLVKSIRSLTPLTNHIFNIIEDHGVAPKKGPKTLPNKEALQKEIINNILQSDDFKSHCEEEFVKQTTYRLFISHKLKMQEYTSVINYYDHKVKSAQVNLLIHQIKKTPEYETVSKLIYDEELKKVKEYALNEANAQYKQIEDSNAKTQEIINKNESPAIISQPEEYTDLKKSLIKYQTILKSIDDSVNSLYEHFEYIDPKKFNKYKKEIEYIVALKQKVYEMGYFKNGASRWSLKSFPFSQAKAQDAIYRLNKIRDIIDSIINEFDNIIKKAGMLYKKVNAVLGGSFYNQSLKPISEVKPMIESISNEYNKNYWLYLKPRPMPSDFY